MFNISNTTIAHECNPATYKAGKEYFQQNRVRAVQYYQEKNAFGARVLGTKHYDVHVQFDRDGDVAEARCSCPASDKYWGHCKHIAAVLMFIHFKDQQGFFNDLQFRQAAKQIFDLFHNRPGVAKSPVELEVTYEFVKETGYGKPSYSALSFRIGQDKLYVIKDIRKFLDSLDKNEEIEFGKKFVFDPFKHGFKDEDKQLMDYIREMHEAEKLMDDFSYGSNRSSLFKTRQVYLPDSGVKRFFEIYQNRYFKASINGNQEDHQKVRQGNFPVEFSLSGEGRDLLLSIDFDGILIPLTEDGEYVFANGEIYKVSREQQENFKPFYMAMTYHKGRKLRFIEEDKERFVSEILPFAEKAGKLKISEKIQSMIEKVDLEPEIYLDKEIGNTITAEVRFKYGERSINPFAPADEKEYREDKILIRDIEKEQLILDTLGQSDFKVHGSHIHLNGEDKIYDFVFNAIPSLQEFAEVYYSDSFKSLSIRSNFSFSGRIRLNTETDMLEFNFGMDGIDPQELPDIFRSLRERKKYYQLKNGSFLKLDSQEINKVADFLDYLEVDQAALQQNFMEIPKYRAIYLDQRIRDSQFHFMERNPAFKEFVQNIREPEDMNFPLPEGICGTLREYQKLGYKWLKTLSHYGMGGILADDMGLGKTLQVIALILSDRHEKGLYPSLVVVPSSLVYNWCAEVEKFAPELRMVAISGIKSERSRLMEEISASDLVITSYPLIRRDIEAYKALKFRYCILDEAQYIKNPGSVNAQSVKEINAERRFALTGTPMENSLMELWSIFDFILPGYLFSHSRFADKYESPIVREEDRTAAEELGKQIRPFILRRLKTDVLTELPEKIENRMVAELTEEQKKIYLAYLQKIRGEIAQEIAENGFERSHIKILAGLTRLRQLCCHPALFLEDYQGESGKMQLLEEIIQDSIESGHRILLFSQFTSMLHIIENWLKLEKIGYMYLDGSTPVGERGELVRAFNEGQGKVFLISLKAGGTGLNLTGADMVIHFDPWWNPAVEDQATDRAYRIGQKKAVHVIKLITKGTIEEKIFKLQEKKKELIDAVIQPGETLLTRMTQQELQSLFE